MFDLLFPFIDHDIYACVSLGSLRWEVEGAFCRAIFVYLYAYTANSEYREFHLQAAYIGQTLLTGFLLL